MKLNLQLFADGEISYKVTLDSDGAIKSLDKLEDKSSSLSQKFVSVGTKMTVGVTAPLTALATAGVKYNATMETYLANLTTLLGGNQQEAQKLLDTLKEMANTTPYEATDLVKATQKMMAFGISAEDSLKYLNMLGDVAMGDANKMDSLTLAFSQISASGRASMEDINQMIDQGFNPLTIIAEKTGESMADLRDRVSAGQVSFEEIAGAFQIATSEGGIFYQSMDKASQTTQGKISSMTDAFNSAAGALTESLLPFVTQFVTKLTEIFNWLNSLDESQKNMILTVGLVLIAAGPLLTLIGNISGSITKLIPIISGITGPVGLVVGAIGGLIAIFVYLMATNEDFRESVFSIFNAVWGIIGPIIDSIIGAFNGLVDIIKGAVQIIDGLLTGDISKVVEGFSSIFKGIGNVVISVLNTAISAINGFIALALLPLNLLIDGINLIPGVNIPKLKLEIPKIPSLDVGTNFVAQDGLAFLHKGEAVVPQKYNPAIGGGMTTNSPIIVEVYNDNVSTFQLDSKTVAEVVNKYNENREVAV